MVLELVKYNNPVVYIVSIIFIELFTFVFSVLTLILVKVLVILVYNCFL